MYKHILIATDGSELSKRAIDLGVPFAKALNAKVTGIIDSRPWEHAAHRDLMRVVERDSYERRASESAKKCLAEITLVANAAGVECDVVHTTNGHPCDGIISAAKSQGCDLSVMASHGWRGLSGLLIGSETKKVLTHTDIPVLVCR